MNDAFSKGYFEELEKVAFWSLIGGAASLLPVAGPLAPWAARTAGLSATNVARAGKLARFARRPAGIATSIGVPLVAGALANRRRSSQPSVPAYQQPSMPQQPPRLQGAQGYGYY